MCTVRCAGTVVTANIVDGRCVVWGHPRPVAATRKLYSSEHNNTMDAPSVQNEELKL